jgi:outer membrane lipoprotein-sorting protein
MRTRIGVAAAVLAVVVGLAGVGAVRADPTPSLPPVSAADLLASVAASAAQPIAISGEVLTVADLGLPELPPGLGGGASGPIASLTGSQRYKVWASPDGVRVAHLTDLGEEVWVSNHTTAWHWNSDGMTAERIDLAAAGAALRDAVRSRDAGDPGARAEWLSSGAQGRTDTGAPATADPTAMARQALAALAPYGSVAVDGTARVAGRPVYELSVTPSSPLTLIGRITVAVDADTRVPLRLQVFAKGADSAAIEVGFTSVSFDPIDPGVFDFTPPQGATIATPSPKKPDVPAPGDTDPGVGRGPNGAETFGTGFATRVAVPVSPSVASQASLLLPYQGPLASALSVDEGGRTWILFGPVGLDTLRSDAASLT